MKLLHFKAFSWSVWFSTMFLIIIWTRDSNTYEWIQWKVLCWSQYAYCFSFYFWYQGMPIWWRWYYWANPLAWTLYGMIGSQYGDVTAIMKAENMSVQEYVRSSLGIKHDFIGVCAVVVFGCAILFAFIFAVSIKLFNFQKR